MEQAFWFTQQIKDCEPSMYRLAMSIVGNREDAADAAQEAICTAYRRLHTLRDRSKFRPWLLRIMTNECYNILRQRQHFVGSDTLPEQPTLDPEPGGSPLWQAVSALEVGYRTAVVLFYYEGFRVREIAAMLKISEASVKTRLCRARKQLKVLWEEAQ